MASEHGQATIEWTGLLLLLALATAALAALSPRIDGRALGGSVAHAITCAARAACDVGGGHSRDHSIRRRSAESAIAHPGARGRAPPARPGQTLVPVSRSAAAFQVLRGVRRVAQRAWILCLGYRRYVYEREHPRVPTEPMPLGEALDIADTCLNPLGFLEED
jgi:hypothetical protein